MKKFLVVVAAAAFVMFLPSCKKCSTCSYSTPNGDGTNTTIDLDEVCGKKSEVKEYEDACQILAAVYGVNCTCSKS